MHLPKLIAASLAAPLCISAAALAGGTGGPDCNQDGQSDTLQLAQGDLPDCNNNGMPDECDILDGTSQDCNQDGIPDECPVCPPVDVVFVMDTSGSMSDEGNALCNSINGVVNDLLNQGITVNATFLGITQTSFSCLQGTVAGTLGTQVPGNPTCCPTLGNSEDWGPATAIVAANFGWQAGAVRVIVPISDEGAHNGNRCNSQDEESIQNAIAIAVANDVICSPISGTGSSQCVIGLASDLAAGTGGMNFLSTDPNLDLAEAISALLLDACQTFSDCNKNGIPDECDPDSNNNGIPDDCEEGGTSELDCSEFDRYEDLTPNDTLSLITNFHNPNLEQGYLYVAAVDQNNHPIGFDHLIGQSMVIDGLEAFEYGVNAVDYRAMVAEGELTDLDGDTILDLNGLEYEQTAGEILVPRFLGQTQASGSELLMIALTGGRKFETTLDFLVYNDNEVAFSGEHTFRCWDKVPVSEISGIFSNDFLAQFTGDDDNESVGPYESGWIHIDGGVAVSSAASLQDPAFYAVYIERVNGFSAADLPFERCLQSGHLLPNSVSGDNEELPTSDQSCEASIGRREPGSFLLFPEFNNRAGLISLVTVTNTSAASDVRAHFVYIGRFGN